jgi:hypothetical protein
MLFSVNPRSGSDNIPRLSLLGEPQLLQTLLADTRSCLGIFLDSGTVEGRYHGSNPCFPFMVLYIYAVAPLLGSRSNQLLIVRTISIPYYSLD